MTGRLWLLFEPYTSGAIKIAPCAGYSVVRCLHQGEIVEKEKKKNWITKIESRDDALKMVKDTSMGFFVYAGIMVVASFALGFSLLIDAAIYAVGAFFLRRYNSRGAAIVLLIITSIGAVVTLANMAGANLGGGKNIFIAAIFAWAAIRSVEATFKLHGSLSEESVVGETPRT